MPTIKTRGKEPLPDWFRCLSNPKINRALQLIELSETGLCLEDIYSLLNLKKDKTVRGALKDLTEAGFIKKVKSTNAKIIRATWKYETGKKEIKEININGGLRYATRYFSAKNPIEKVFEETEKSAMAKNLSEKDKKILETLKEEIKTRWDFCKREYDFNNNFAYGLSDDYFKKFDDEAKPILEKETPFASLVQDGKNNLLQLKELSQSKKIEKRLEIVSGMTDFFLFETHLDYVVVILQRKLLEYFIERFSRWYFYVSTKQAPSIDLDFVNLIEELIYFLKPVIKKSSLVSEMANRLKNFQGIIQLEIKKNEMAKKVKTIMEIKSGV